MLHGPTASGKTALAIELAQSLGTEVISCDARQVYRELNIGVARPSAAERAAVPHHGIASHSIHEPLTAASYAEWAEPVLRDVIARTGSAVIAGGSGLYAMALLEGLDPMPPANPALRADLEQRWLSDPLALTAELQRLDPSYAASADLQNGRRVVRALEVIALTGIPYSQQRRGSASREWPLPVREVVLEAHMDWLEARIAQRSRQMMANGLRDEALRLQEWANLTPLHTVGYREFYEPGAPVHDDIQMAERISLRTRQYAKRQKTWLSKRTEALRVPAERAWAYLRNHGNA
jgi:tRNA dimethylallyltransferase